ncbi:MAG TPA: peptidoglycan recognition family protein [Solirubrobacterales bacterium]|jgi:hypothetical protein|nr:N-acetylmuramoyl-L-alanine amidase [Solirubrobacterales bacterium]HMX70127.1 peptidoglycan recognition family protein [Solirubrobacterales bacterium]HNA23342.1 peptidoglycan recognition family protein [Solirubrobacterales bacterium]HNA43269.1 peptidoglycan recognition family protein [Solirubrobacterales bacterium]HNC04996.1 peptidoglycan recognition family protein [Solirubrobacterales bacterium]
MKRLATAAAAVGLVAALGVLAGPVAEHAGSSASANGVAAGPAAGAAPPGAARQSNRAALRMPAWIHRHFIPFGAKRKHQMARYSLRHYGVRSWRLRNPRQIVEHVAVGNSVAGVYRTFAANRPDPEFHELPNVCAHFVVSGRGRVVQLVPLGIRCRHTVGLNHVSFGIEHTGFTDGDVLGNPRQMRASIRLTKWLRCRYGIGIRDVIGHNESLGSRFHRELVPAMKNQTHGDFRHASMRRYRKALHDAGRCPRA